MSLYYDAATILGNPDSVSGSLKSGVFSAKTLKSPPKQVFALISEATKWSSVLTEVIDKSQLLHLERKVRQPPIAYSRNILTDSRVNPPAFPQSRPPIGPRSTS